MLTILVPVAIVAAIVIVGVLAFQRGRDGFDLSANPVPRTYLYLGSFAGVIALAFGLLALLNGALATAVGNDFVYGRFSPSSWRVADVVDRGRLEDLVRGATYTLFGALFYGAHRWARRSMYPRARTVGESDGLRRAYLLLGTIVFGVGTIALLPAGVYQVLANALLPSSTDFYRGVADNLTGGIVSFVIWLLYLRAVLRDARGGSPRFYRAGPSRPPAEPAPRKTLAS